jgi:16S rRNA (uracil1498-N3)-methyltransferase
VDLYFGPKSNRDEIVLEEEELNHLFNSKRAKPGDEIIVTDGKGKLFTAELISRDKKNPAFKIISVIENKKKPFHLHIAVAPTKNNERIEWFLEKAVETGIDEISFVICRHSERREIKLERMNRVLIAAVKQSMNTWLPVLNEPVDFKKFIAKNFTGNKLICSMNADEQNTLGKMYVKGNNLTAVIGPEGDFHADELQLAEENGFQFTSLGKSRLRTETAALNVCTICNFLNTQ